MPGQSRPPPSSSEARGRHRYGNVHGTPSGGARAPGVRRARRLHRPARRLPREARPRTRRLARRQAGRGAASRLPRDAGADRRRRPARHARAASGCARRSSTTPTAPAAAPPTRRCCRSRSPTELLHTYLLIHDDIMDHAEVRRGQPAAHVRFRDAHRRPRLHGDAGRLRPLGRPSCSATSPRAGRWSWRPASGRLPALARAGALLLRHVPGGHRRPVPGAAGGPAPRHGRREEELLRVLRLKSGRYTAERPIQLGALLAGRRRRRLRRPRPATARRSARPSSSRTTCWACSATPGPWASRWTPTSREGKFTFLIHHALAAATPEQRRTLEAALGNPDATARRGGARRAGCSRRPARARPVTAMVERAPARRPRRPRRSSGPAHEGRLFLEGLIDYLLGARALSPPSRPGSAVRRNRRSATARPSTSAWRSTRACSSATASSTTTASSTRPCPRSTSTRSTPSVEFLGRRLAAPLLISCMTGGTETAGRINRNLAAGAERTGVAVGVGSQRKALEDPGES